MVASNKPSLKSIRRKRVSFSKESLVKTRAYADDQALPFVYEPAAASIDLVSWVNEHRDQIRADLLKHGALLFRGFDIADNEAFQQFCSAVSPDLLDYVERAAPRNALAKKVYTSTEYPKEHWIPLHHEMSYSHNWPTVLFFYCDVEPEVDGYTPFTNEREVIQKLPKHLKQPFLDKGVMYVRNYGEGVDMSWQETFQTEDKAEVEAYLRRTSTEFEWLSDSRLRTKMRRQVTATHPQTGDTVWFNHAHMFHISNMPEATRNALREEFADHELPRNSFYGDGSPIPDEVATEIREFYKSQAITFPWRKGDVLILDNFLTAHGRTPFEGQRRIAVAMAELYVNKDYDKG